MVEIVEADYQAIETGKWEGIAPGDWFVETGKCDGKTLGSCFVEPAA